MATELAPVEGLHFAKLNVLDSLTAFAFLVYGQTVAAGTITSLTTMSGLNEENGTGYVRQAVSLGVDSNGIQTVPAVTWNPGAATNWHTNVSACGIASAVTAGVALFIWDLAGGPYNMSPANTNLLVPAVDYFFQNPGGI